MTLLINPGSRVGPEGVGWKNTADKAQEKAEAWLEEMRRDGIADVEILPVVEGPTRVDDYRWSFTFRHTVTSVEVLLEIDGIDDMKAFEKQCIFPPKIYWNGSSVGNPEVEDFCADGFEVVKTLRRLA